MQRPVISTNVAAINELVSTGQTGWLIPPANIDALVDAMRQAMLADPQSLTDLGRRGRHLVLKRHHTPTEAAKLESLFAASAARDQETR
jgi:glycosyltransferase involved in cell wall biosynthesis